MKTFEGQAERRRDVRISPKGTAIMRITRADPYVLGGRVANLCRGGLLVATRTTAVQRILGEKIEISLRLDGGETNWFELGAQVLRINASSVAMSLHTMPPGFTQYIDDTVSRSERNDRMLSVVLVDATEVRRRAMAEAFRSGGCTVIEVSTPLEAIVRLGESHFEPDLIAIADSQPAATSDEMRRFVEIEHPGARLVTINDAASAEGLELWLSSMNPNADLPARIRRVLVTFGGA